MPEKWDTKVEKVRSKAEMLDNILYDIQDHKSLLRRLQWDKKKAETEIVHALLEANMEEYLKVDFKNLKVFLNEMSI